MGWLRFKFHHRPFLHSNLLLSLFILTISFKMQRRSQRHRRQQKMAGRWHEYSYNHRNSARVQLNNLYCHRTRRRRFSLGLQTNYRACVHSLSSYFLAIIFCLLLRGTKPTRKGFWFDTDDACGVRKIDLGQKILNQIYVINKIFCI